MTTAARSLTEVHARPPSLPPLESGDRLTSAEFERRYRLHPEIRRAELIEGVVRVASPMHHTAHGAPQRVVSTWLGLYQSQNPDVDGGDGSTTRLDAENNVQPDSFLRYRTGTSRVTEDDYIAGAPELAFEVAASSAAVDLGPKMRAYRRNGVQEYVVWQLYENRLSWFSLEDGEYVELQPDGRGVISSKVFPGLRLAVQKLLDRDIAGVLAEQNRRARKARRAR